MTSTVATEPSTTVKFLVDGMTSTTNTDTVFSKEKPIFLQTKAAQVIAGVFVWVALFLTCQQVFNHNTLVICCLLLV